MKTIKLLPLLLALSVWVTSCTDTRYVTQGRSYEDDEVYYQPGETFITDLQQIEVPQEDDYVNEQNTYEEDEYYTEQNADVINNYYGSGWNLGANYGLANPAGSYWTWNPIWGWRLSYNWGWGSVGFGNGWGSPWYCDPWYCDPWFYDPWVGGPWGYSPWGWNNGWGWAYNYGYGYWAYNPYCYYGNPYYNGGGWIDGGAGGGSGVYYGHHDPISTGSTINSGYTGGALFSDRILKPSRPEGKPEITGEQVTDMVMRKPLVDKQRPGTDLSAGTDDRLDPGLVSKPVISRPSIQIPESSTREDDYFAPREKPRGDAPSRPAAREDRPSSQPVIKPADKDKGKSRDRSDSKAPSPAPSRDDRKPSISPSPGGGGSSPSRSSNSSSGSSSSGGRGSGSTGSGSSGGGRKR